MDRVGAYPAVTRAGELDAALLAEHDPAAVAG
jgi:hypothetical protein